MTHGRNCSRRAIAPSRVGAPMLVALLALTGCAEGSGATADAGAPPAGCTDGGLAVTAPAAEAAVASGPLTLAGTTPQGGSTVSYSVRDASGTEIAAGSTPSAGDAPSTFTVPLSLGAGSYTAELWAVQDGTGGCTTTTSRLEVADATAPRWSAGASGAGVPDGSFAAWRGSEVPMAGTWADNNAGQIYLWPLTDEYAGWSGDLEMAIGAISDEDGETWAAAARGDYDERWSESLQKAAELWSGHSGTLYLRFAHEFNGHWYSWSVTPESVRDFIAGWQRFRALQQQHFPAAKLVFAPNSESASTFGMDWRQAYPGPGQVDVISMSYFNHWPYCESAAEFQELALRYDQFGGPRGIQRHLEFARSVGLPFAVSEWGVVAKVGDSPAWMEQMYGFFNANAGDGPGQLRYEILFNVARDGDNDAVFPTTNAPNGAEDYARLW